MSNIDWNETYVNISPKLMGICRRYIKDTATAEDIVHDSFIVAIQKENTLKNANAINGWLSRIVINMAIHHLKETKKINFSTSEDYDLVDNSTLMNTLEMNNKSMLLASDINRDDLLEAIDSLPEHYKSVFNMYVIDQFSHNEIAKILTIPVGTSKSNLSRARKAIQEFLLEKLNLKSVDEKKKRRIAFLLFFGLENKMFANFYQSKFRDFEIYSEKPIALVPKNVSFPADFTGLSNEFLVYRIATMGFVFLFFIGAGFYAYDFGSHSNNAIREQIEMSPKTGNNRASIPDFDSVKNEAAPIDEVPESAVSNTMTVGNKTEKTIQKITEEPIPEAKKDSAKAESPKVIVVKKSIIKKDTVYVTK
jgi:RNA polymerase sigma factor (sigma-70 family)